MSTRVPGPKGIRVLLITCEPRHGRTVVDVILVEEDGPWRGPGSTSYGLCEGSFVFRESSEVSRYVKENMASKV